MSPEQRPRPGGASPAGKTKLPGYSARRSGPAWERRGHGGRRPGGRGGGRGSRSRRPYGVIGAVVGVVLFGAVLAALIFSTQNDDPTEEARGPTTTFDPSSLSPDGQELYALVEASGAGTYHVALGLVTVGAEGQAPATVIEVWRKSDQVREQSADAAATSTLVFIGGPDGAMNCSQAAGQPAATCEPAPSEQSGLDQLFAAIVAMLPDGDIVATDATIAALSGRCFTVTAEEETSELCFSADGVPLRIGTGGISYEATLVDANVPDDILVLPAAGGPPPPASTVPPPPAPPTTALPPGATTTTAAP